MSGRQKNGWNLLAFGKKDSFFASGMSDLLSQTKPNEQQTTENKLNGTPWQGLTSLTASKTGLRKIGIIAGSGSLPGCLAEACLKADYPFFVVALKGHADLSKLPAGTPMQTVRLGAIGKIFSVLHKAGVQELVLVGGVRRPSVAEMRPDLRALSFFARLGMKALGDDGLLRAVINEVESEGFTVRGIHELMPELLAPVGVLGLVEPTTADEADILRGVSVASLLGQADVGQAVIVQQGLVLSLEGIEGTRALIERTKVLKRKGSGGVLVKMVKPRQERRIDLPTIGVETVQAISDAGLKGIAVEAHGVLIADLAETIQKADALDIFIIGVAHG